MEKTTHHIDSLISEAGDYIEAKTELWKLRAVDKTSEVISSVSAKIVIYVMGFFFFTLLNLGIALWLGEMMGRSYYGFFTLAGFYAIVLLIIYQFRHTWLKEPVNNMLIRKILK